MCQWGRCKFIFSIECVSVQELNILFIFYSWSYHLQWVDVTVLHWICYQAQSLCDWRYLAHSFIFNYITHLCRILQDGILLVCKVVWTYYATCESVGMNFEWGRWFVSFTYVDLVLDGRWEKILFLYKCGMAQGLSVAPCASIHLYVDPWVSVQNVVPLWKSNLFYYCLLYGV